MDYLPERPEELYFFVGYLESEEEDFAKMERFHQKVANAVIPLYPGIALCYLTFSTDSFSVQHKALSHIIQIHYCKAGQMMWEMKNGNRIYLNSTCTALTAYFHAF